MKLIHTKSILLMIAGAVIISLLTSCASMGVKPWAERTPIEKSLSFMQFYNVQYADTMNLATSQSSTPAQKDLAAKKKAILKDLWPLVKLYDSYAQGGIQIPPDLESQILVFINKIGGTI